MLPNNAYIYVHTFLPFFSLFALISSLSEKGVSTLCWDASIWKNKARSGVLLV